MNNVNGLFDHYIANYINNCSLIICSIYFQKQIYYNFDISFTNSVKLTIYLSGYCIYRIVIIDFNVNALLLFILFILE